MALFSLHYFSTCFIFLYAPILMFYFYYYTGVENRNNKEFSENTMKDFFFMEATNTDDT